MGATSAAVSRWNRRAQTMVAIMLHTLPMRHGSSAPMYLAVYNCGKAKARPETRVAQNTPLMPLNPAVRMISR